MDRPVLYSLVERLRAEDSLTEFAAAMPTRARVSEPVLPLVLAALHEEVGRGLIVVLPEDADARDAAEAASWFIGDEQVGLFPSRGVHWGSGLEPPPHLVGERARALAVLERGGLVCASATAVAEGLPPVAERAQVLRVARGDEPGIDSLAEQLASAGYERVERVEERGQFAVRGGLVDVFPTTGREPLRIELFGDEIEQIRAFSPFTQRALRQVEEATVFPAGERRRELVEIDLGMEEGEEAFDATVPEDLVPPFDRAFHALMTDLDRSGQLDETLVVVAAEFGRSPKVTRSNRGREHWPDCFSVLFAGGGIRGGQVYGQSDKLAAYPKENPVTPADFTATLYHCLGIDPTGETHDQGGRPLVLSRGAPIGPLVG